MNNKLLKVSEFSNDRLRALEELKTYNFEFYTAWMENHEKNLKKYYAN